MKERKRANEGEKVKLSLKQAVDADRVVRHRGFHIF
jgi:hypothetical protein